MNMAQLNSQKFLALTRHVFLVSSLSFHKRGPERDNNISLHTFFVAAARIDRARHNCGRSSEWARGGEIHNIYFLGRIQVEPFERDVMKIITPHGYICGAMGSH